MPVTAVTSSPTARWRTTVPHGQYGIRTGRSFPDILTFTAAERGFPACNGWSGMCVRPPRRRPTFGAVGGMYFEEVSHVSHTLGGPGGSTRSGGDLDGRGTGGQ